MDDLIPFCTTERQREYLRSLQEHGTSIKAAEALGVSAGTVRGILRDIRERAALRGYSPGHDLTEPLAPGQILKGYTNNYWINEKGEKVLKQQYIKTAISKEEMDLMLKEAAEGFFKNLPKIKPPKVPRKYDKDIIPWVQIGDAHIGMLAHRAETGENFDLRIAEVELCKAFDLIFARIEKCERIVIQDMGDGTHYETFAGQTEASGHALDFDGRYPRMIRVYSRVFRYAIDRALQVAKHVDVIINQGNHSRSNDIMMAELIDVAYSHTGRVHVLNNDCVFIPYRMGNTFVMCHHSDKCKPGKLADVMQTDFSRDWGESEYRYIDIGHIHHNMVLKEHPGVRIESFNQLAPPDKWAYEGGWRSRSCLTVVNRSRTYGEVGRITMPVEMVRDVIGKLPAGGSIKRREVYTV